MKSAHRHELETNALAHRLEGFIERCRPYSAHIVGVLIAILAVIVIWSFVVGSSASRQSSTWDAYNQAVVSTSFGSPTSLDEIHRTAQEYQGTEMQRLADVTWADGQVYNASRNYLSNRSSVEGSLEKAASVYQSVIDSSRDENLASRARLGLARVYEMQNHLEKARDEYRQVTGPYAAYAQQQAVRLENPEVKDTCAWLATAELPKPKGSGGPGAPGRPPEFSPTDMSLPPAGGDASKAGAGKPVNDAFENLLKNLREESKKGESPDRYKNDQKGAAGSNGSSAEKGTASPADAKGTTTPSSGGAGSKPAESSPASKSSATDKSAK